MAQLTFRGAYEAERAARTPRRNRTRTPLLTHLARGLARALPTWDAARSFVLSVSGLAAVCAGAFQLATAAGWVAVGLSLLVLEFLTGGDR